MADVAPTTIENVPAEHPVHEVEDRSTLYLPALQSLQSEVVVLPSCSEYLPASQDWQTRADIAAHSDENLPFGHSWQDAEPSSAENVPIPHSSQTELVAAPVSAACLPAAHLRHAA